MPTLRSRLAIAFARVFPRAAYEDVTATAEAIRETDREWPIVRPPLLNDGPKTGRVVAGYLGNGLVGGRLARANAADFMLRQLQGASLVRQAPLGEQRLRNARARRLGTSAARGHAPTRAFRPGFRPQPWHLPWNAATAFLPPFVRRLLAAVGCALRLPAIGVAGRGSRLAGRRARRMTGKPTWRRARRSWLVHPIPDPGGRAGIRRAGEERRPQRGRSTG
ncbi:NAD(P)H-binding protein [Arthrobacter sp. AETb3-4]|uniref:NAD(P)H-binding protein n=1 Tax=Arthrobacter wenxiniae TaxID=2713570 RepID=A0A7Y7IEX7_9MICC|nr:NAD(P)H-binding protein [Arthrobacter wenxiniae]